MYDRRTVIEKEPLDSIQRGLAYLFEESEAEGLSAGRVDAVEDRISAAALNPFGVAFGELAPACLCILRAGKTLRAFQPL